jgi:thioredoxin-related protein
MRILLLFAATGLLLCASTHAKESWFEDVQQALAKARQEDKDLFLLYTGSDWCPACQKFESEVLGEADFLEKAGQHFVLVRLDFPKKKKLPAEIIEQNRIWAEKFGIDGYPTVVLIDRDQRPFGISGYRPGGVENYLEILGEFTQQRIRRDEALSKVEALDGDARARMLDQAISELDPALVRLYYEDIVAKIVGIDNDDRLGLRSKWNAARDAELRKIIMTDIVVVSRLEKPAVAIAFIDDVLDKIRFSARERLQILQIKLNLLRKANQVQAMDQLLDEMTAMDELTEDARQRLTVKKILLMAGTGRRAQGMTLLNQAIEQSSGNAAHLWLAKGQLFEAEQEFQQAVECYDQGINSGDPSPDTLIDLFGAKADSYMALDNELRALQTLDQFAQDESMPADLRAEALLQKAMIMRDSGRNRRAALVENRAIEIAESGTEQAEIRKLVERLRSKYGG